METTGVQGLNDEAKLYPYLDLHPSIAESVFLAPGVKIIGDVEIGEDSSVWYNSVIRGDVHYIKIGKLTNIQDCCMLHVTNDKFPLNIGDKVTIGHSVSLHGCTINDLCLIGIGATILDGAIVEEKSIVAAGALVRQNFVVPTGMLVAGVPARVLRDLTAEELDEFERSAIRYKEYTKHTIDSLKNRNIK